ncbi:MAG: FecR family protein [Bacteroidales bacterium]
MKKDFNLTDVDDQLIIRFFNGQLSIQETDELEKWIEASPENRELFRIYQRTWIGSSAAFPDEKFNPGKAWRNIAHNIHKPSYRSISQSRKQTRKLYIKVARTAAMVLVVFALGALVSYFSFSGYKNFAAGEICEMSVPQGSISNIVLPDGSTVWLNAGSTISYSGDFNHTARTVKLEGEAFFDVTTNPKKPFIVNTSHLNVKALGTQFNVKAYPDDDAVLTTLVEGNVIIDIPELKNPFTYNLEPRQSLIYRKSDSTISSSEPRDEVAQKENKPDEQLVKVQPQTEQKSMISVKNNIKPELYTSWKDETWIIEGETIAEMAVMLERRYNTKINIHAEELKSYRFTGKIMNETLEQVLEILRLTAPLEYSVGKGVVDWKIDSELKDDYDILIHKPGS